MKIGVIIKPKFCLITPQKFAFLVGGVKSLVSADLLYGIHFRLMKEAFQNKEPFGGVAMVCFGDIMQIKPVQGTPVFEEIHKNPQLSLHQSIDNLWRNFSVIMLKTNHRQGKDRDYANILNRVRVGQWTDDDRRC